MNAKNRADGRILREKRAVCATEGGCDLQQLMQSFSLESHIPLRIQHSDFLTSEIAIFHITQSANKYVSARFQVSLRCS
jgi:hypothetical protein